MNVEFDANGNKDEERQTKPLTEPLEVIVERMMREQCSMYNEQIPTRLGWYDSSAGSTNIDPVNRFVADQLSDQIKGRLAEGLVSRFGWVREAASKHVQVGRDKDRK